MLADERAGIIQRLCAVSQSLYTLHALVETGVPCREMLRQLYTVQAELQAIKVQLFNCQLNTSTRILRFNPFVENRLVELQRLFDLYNTLIQSI